MWCQVSNEDSVVGRRITNTIPGLTRASAIMRLGPMASPRIRAPLRNTPKTGVKKVKAWMRLTGWRRMSSNYARSLRKAMIIHSLAP